MGPVQPNPEKPKNGIMPFLMINYQPHTGLVAGAIISNYCKVNRKGCDLSIIQYRHQPVIYPGGEQKNCMPFSLFNTIYGGETVGVSGFA